MIFDRKSLLLYVVTDRSWLGEKSLSGQVDESIKNGATFVQLREKDISFESFTAIAREIKTICARHNVPFVINDNIDVALAVDVDGVHIGQSDIMLSRARSLLGNDKIIGVSAGSLEEALQAKKGGADYIGVGAVFPTETKKDAESVSIDLLKKITGDTNIPTVAIGGIGENNISQLAGSGIDGVAVISAVFAQQDIGSATKNLRILAEKVVNLK